MTTLAVMVRAAFEIFTVWKPSLITQHPKLHHTCKQIQVHTENALLETINRPRSHCPSWKQMIMKITLKAQEQTAFSIFLSILSQTLL